MVNLEAGVYGRTGFVPASIMKIGSIEIFQLCRLPPIVAISNGDPELGADINMSAPCPRSRGKRKGAALKRDGPGTARLLRAMRQAAGGRPQGESGHAGDGLYVVSALIEDLPARSGRPGP